MAEDTDQQPAAAETGPLTESAAAALLANLDNEPEQKEPQISSARAKANAAEETTESTEVDTDSEAESETEAETQEAEDTTDAKESDDDYVHGNAKTRLRDGREVTIGELKKAFDEAQEFRRKEAEFTTAKQEFDAKTAQAAQQEQLFASTIQQAITALQNTLPTEPDAGLRESDPIAYFLAKDAREAKLHEIGRLQQAQAAQAEKQSVEQAEQFKQRIGKEQAMLYDRIPEFRDDAKRTEFWNELVTRGRDYYGFSEDEVSNISDHRVMMMAKDAIAYRKLQAAKPKVAEKGKTAKPVVKPGERAASSSDIRAKHKTLFERAAKTRSIDDVGALLAELE